MRLRGALLWDADGEPRRDEVLISDERPNGSGSRIVILDDGGRPRAASPNDLPPGSVLLLQSDASDADIGRIQDSGYVAQRTKDQMLDPVVRVNGDQDEADLIAGSGLDEEARRAAIEEAEAELDEVAERLQRLLQDRHPDLFDSDGQLRMDAYSQKMLERTGGRTTLTREEILALEGDRPFPTRGPDSADAP